MTNCDYNYELETADYHSFFCSQAIFQIILKHRCSQICISFDKLRDFIRDSLLRNKSQIIHCQHRSIAFSSRYSSFVLKRLATNFVKIITVFVAKTSLTERRSSASLRLTSPSWCRQDVSLRFPARKDTRSVWGQGLSQPPLRCNVGRRLKVHCATRKWEALDSPNLTGPFPLSSSLPRSHHCLFAILDFSF